MKKLAFLLTLVMTLGLLAGCAGTPVVYYTECNCPTGGNVQQDEQAPAVVVEGAVKTGIAVVGNAGDSKDATEAAFDVTIVGVTVDDTGVIQSCIIDGLGAKALTDHRFLSQMLNTSGEAEVGTNVDAISGATVTSKAVVRSVNSAVAFVTGADVSSGATSWGG